MSLLHYSSSTVNRFPATMASGGAASGLRRPLLALTRRAISVHAAGKSPDAKAAASSAKAAAAPAKTAVDKKSDIGMGDLVLAVEESVAGVCPNLRCSVLV